MNTAAVDNVASMPSASRPCPYREGDLLPAFKSAPISRAVIALFAGASNDHNPIHIDIDAARAAGLDDVFVQGMLPMAYLGRMLTDVFGQDALREFGVRFVNITYVHDALECIGRVETVEGIAGGWRVGVAVSAINPRGDLALSGDAVIELKS
jgi:acyl dehydratase